MIKHLNQKATIACLALFALIACGLASEPVKRSEHTYKLADNAQSPPATFADVHWMVGTWKGEAFGGTFEETWNPPSGGTMIGLFKYLENGQPEFYELLLLAEENSSLIMKVKHFNADFSAWEEKPDFVKFPLVKVEENAVHFSGLSFYRQQDGNIQGYLLLNKKDGVVEEPLVYSRQ